MKEIMKFFYEIGQLKRVKRSGWWIAKIKDPESVAEHSFRTAIIGYVLSKLENVDSYKVLLMCLFQDVPEARLNDLHKVGHRYVDFRKAEKDAFNEQLERLPKESREELKELFEDFQTHKSKEGVVAKDADLLECAVTAKEYIEIGYKDAQNWIDNVEKYLKTKSAKEFLEIMKKTGSDSWWQGLKKTAR